MNDSISSRNIIRSLLNTLHSHCAVHLPSSPPWLSWLFYFYLLTYLLISNISENVFRLSTSLNMLYCAVFMCRWSASVIETDVVGAKNWLIPSGAQVWVVPPWWTRNMICCWTNSLLRLLWVEKTNVSSNKYFFMTFFFSKHQNHNY